MHPWVALRQTIRADGESAHSGRQSRHCGRKSATWTHIDRDHEQIRIDMQTLLHNLGIAFTATAA